MQPSVKENWVQFSEMILKKSNPKFSTSLLVQEELNNFGG
jgi:hypothetical protein